MAFADSETQAKFRCSLTPASDLSPIAIIVASGKWRKPAGEKQNHFTESFPTIDPNEFSQIRSKLSLIL